MKGRAHFNKIEIAGKTDKRQDPPYHNITDLIEKNGNTHVDILKMDIEGYEFEALNVLVESFRRRGGSDQSDID
jgi:FkbM family methyltransferase